MTRRTYTPAELRELAKDRGPFYADNSRAALIYCADVIESANKLIDEYRRTAAMSAAAKQGDKP